MTILHKNRMTSLGVPNDKHLQLNAEIFTAHNSLEQNRARSERALSLALPQSSLLDFYDPQQQQCNSVALLPANLNGVVRRHSSHCYPMFDEKPHQSQQQAQANNQSNIKKNPLSNTGATTAPSIFLYDSTENDNLLMESLPADTVASAIATTAKSISLPLPAIVNSHNKQQQQPADLPTLNPPPPIPKRTFRGKCMNTIIGSTSLNLPDSSIIENSSPVEVRNKLIQQQQQQQQQQTAFIYPQTIEKKEEKVNYIEIPNADTLFSENVLDMSVLCDDDRLSLENSVFDESTNTTPVKVSNNKITNKPLTGLAVGADLTNAAKRANRASNSTVDSAITSSSMSSGYGSSSHSENLPTSANIISYSRSRFSSIDTESSLDCCSNTEKSNEMRNIHNQQQQEHDGMQNFNNCVNNNDELQYNNHSNNSYEKQNLNPHFLPMVPQRKQQNNAATRSTFASGQKQQQQEQQGQQQYLSNSLTRSIHKSNSSSNDSKALMTVSASTSTSSTASAGSGCMTGGSTMSLSTATASNTTISPLTYNAPPQMEMKNNSTTATAIPPLPPARNVPEIENKKPLTGATKTIRNKLGKNRPPPIVYPKLHQRQDSNLSSDSFSGTSSPGYNSNAPLLQNAARINRSGPGMAIRDQDSNDSFNMTASRYGFSGLGQPPIVPPKRGKFNCRQDSNISSDSFSQTSSPGYNTKILEAPLIPALSVKRLCNVPTPIVCKQKFDNENIEELNQQALPMSPLTKYATPTSLQTIVRFQNGTPNTMSLQHQIINRRKSSNPYITNGRLKFRLFQVLLNAFALLAIAGGLAAYFNAYPTIKFVNKTIINTIHVDETASYGKNPAPGTCLPIIVKFCQAPQIPYNYTVFPNYIGHFGQLETQVDLESYEALVDVRCYELVSLFLCTLFVPKCGSTGATVPPCKTLCTETMRRCGFFFDVFGLSLPEYLNCKLFKDFESAEDCVGLEQVRDVMIAASNPVCDGFQCDQNRCVPKSYVCDGHLDCMDQTDEANCERCAQDEIYCGEDNCISSKHICDGVIDCPHGQDERNCIRLSDRNGDLGKGVLEVFRISSREWTPACVKNWDRAVSPTVVCSMLGYSSVNATSVITQKTHRPLLTSVNVSSDIWKMYERKRSNLMQEFINCKPDEDYPIAELTCSNYECGKVKRERHKPSVRIIGGSQSNPGSWPFLAAILGGPEKIFYCAGVLISDQWVLTASHCIGNHTIIDLEDWTIQLGVTRRNSFTYTGQKVKVKAVIPHPQYNTAIAHDNDIALFQLATRVSFHEHLLPVCLPPQGLHKLPSEQLCTVIGWGKRQDKDPKSTYEPIVNEVQVPIIKRQQCDEWLDNLTVSDGMICAGYEEGGRDACQGDSGGPLLCPYPGEKDRWFVGGIVSWGIMCAHPKLPGVYANVIKYVPWIQEQMQKYSKPLTDDKYLKFDAHPGGPDILSNMGTNLIKSRKQMSNTKRNRKDILMY